MAETAHQILGKVALQKQLADRFLDPQACNWARFDAELGYPLRDSVAQDGMDGSYTFSTYPGARRYYIGHYNPKGNHFFAYSVKDALVDWPEPKPPANSDTGLPANAARP
jgi:hypothetical protein